MRRSSLLAVAVLASFLPVVLSGAHGASAAAIGPGGRIVTASEGRLETSNPDGTGVRVLISGAQIDQAPFHPVFSHDGTKIAYTRGGSAICVMAVDGSGHRCPVDSLGGSYHNWDPAWSPDDRTLYFNRAGFLERVNVDGTGYGQFPVEGLEGRAVRSFEWSPDRRHYVIATQVASEPVTLAVGAFGDPLVPLTTGPESVTEPHWSPDGTRIAYSSHNGITDPFRVVLVNSDGTDRRVLAERGVVQAWSPDGSKVLYYDSATGALHTVNVDGTGRTRIDGRGGTADWRRGTTAAVSAAAGGAHTLVVRADGTVTARGLNAAGQLGDSTVTDRPLPVVVPGLPPIATAAAGWLHSAAAANDGRVWAWGWNGAGQLGDGSRNDTATPRPVVGLRDVVAVGAGMAHTVALKSDGTVWTWGWNALGQLGDGSNIDRASPVPVPIAGFVKAIAVGALHTLALDTYGQVWAWGHGGYGQLGQRSTLDFRVPAVVPLGARATAVGAGLLHSAAMADGYLRTWGWNGLGQLGDGSTVDRSSPVALSPQPPFSPVSIGAGAAHTLVANRDGRLWTWGYGEQGQTGQGEGADVAALKPVAVPVPDPVFTVSSGWFHSVAVGIDGRVMAWGHNAQGQVGNGSRSDVARPAVVAG